MTSFVSIPPFHRAARGVLAPAAERDRVARGLAVAVFAVFVTGFTAVSARAGDWTADRARAAIESAAEVGLRAPACELVPLEVEGDGAAGAEASVRGFEGRVTLVDFWASWCPTCEQAFAFLDALARDYRDAGLEVVAINLDANPRDARAFLAGRHVGFEVLRDATGRCPRGFGLVGMPQAFLIDASGRVRAVSRGFRPGEARAMRARIEALLAGAPEALPAVAAGPAADADSPAAVAPAPAPTPSSR